MDFFGGQGDFELLSKELNSTAALPDFEEEDIVLSLNMSFNSFYCLKVLVNFINI